MLRVGGHSSNYEGLNGWVHMSVMLVKMSLLCQLSVKIFFDLFQTVVGKSQLIFLPQVGNFSSFCR